MRPLPALTPASEWFWTSGADGKLRIQGCDDCGTLVHPPVPVCPKCHSSASAPREVSGRATVVGFTVNIQQWLPDMTPPYVIAVVTIDESDDVRLTTNIVGVPPAEVHIGQRVQVSFEHHEDVWLPVFSPTGEPDETRDLVGEPNLPAPRPPLSSRRFEHDVVLSGIGRSKIGRRLEGGTSVHSTGSSPGFISEAVPLVLSSIQRRLDRIVINEYADMSKRDSPGLLFDVMGYGKPMTEFDAVRAEYLAGAFGSSLSVVADALGMPIDEFVSGGELAAATDDIEIAAGLLPKGSVAAQRVSVIGMRGGKPFLEFHANWYCTKEIEPAWDNLQDSGWRIIVEGDSPMDVSLTFTVPLEKMAETSPNFTGLLLPCP